MLSSPACTLANKMGINRFILRDFSFDEQALEKQRQELETVTLSEKELWVSYPPPRVIGLVNCLFQTELLRLSRINFSESFQALVHLKVVRLFVESVLRYGPPAHFVGVAIQVRLIRRLFVHSQLDSLPNSQMQNRQSA